MEYQNVIALSELPIWETAAKSRSLLSIVFELTARCNNACPHCYINLPAEDFEAQQNELAFDQIRKIADEAEALGVLWVTLSGGEPLLRDDFAEIYLYLKKRGFLVSLLTNASLVTDAHIRLFKQFPPREIEVTVYGISSDVHARVTGRATFDETMAGIDLMVRAGLPVNLKCMVISDNLCEFHEIAEFCRKRTTRAFRFDPLLHFRLDRDEHKNRLIASRRISPEQILAIEKSDPERRESVKRKWSSGSCKDGGEKKTKKLFRCMAGINSCCIGSAGELKLCSAMVSKTCTYDLKNGSLVDAWKNFVPKVIQMESSSHRYLNTCGGCALHDLCAWCPAHADLESGEMDGCIDYFCKVAHKRLEMVAG